MWSAVVTEYPDVPRFTIEDITGSTVTLNVNASLGDSKVTQLDVIFYVGDEIKSQIFTSLGDHVITGLYADMDYEMEVKLSTDLNPSGVQSPRKTFKTSKEGQFTKLD